MSEEQNPWKTLSTEQVYESPWISVTKHDVINPAGNPGIYSVVHFKNLAIGILPLDTDYNTWIIGQYRYPINQYSWEIVEGGGEMGVDPVDSASRELLEEAGIKAKKYTPILNMHMSNSATDEYAIVYIAQDLSFHEAEPEDTELLAIRKLPFSELYEMVANGEITDSLTVAAVLKAKILIDKKTI